jgi:hypothetical protein
VYGALLVQFFASRLSARANAEGVHGSSPAMAR